VRIVSLEAFYLLYVYHWWAASPLLAANENKKNGVVPKLIRFLPKLNKCLCHGLYQRMGRSARVCPSSLFPARQASTYAFISWK
jgi:hypothetical protein